jgi:hypothetical protein
MFLLDRRRHFAVAWWVLWIVFSRVPVLFLSPARKEPAGADEDERACNSADRDAGLGSRGKRG